jgi:hypothetical protein
VPATRFGDAVTALAAAYTASVALAGVPVYDGDTVTARADQDFIITGHDGSIDNTGALASVAPAGEVTQEWMSLAPPARDEKGSIHCVAVSQTGDAADIPGRRARVQVLLDACEDAATGAQDAAGIMFDGTIQATFVYRQNTQGCAVMCAFTVGYSSPW